MNDDLFISSGLSVLALAAGCGLLFLAHFLLTLPMRRAERARLFLDLIEMTANEGKPLEETLVAISSSREPALGVRFHALAAWLESGCSFADALDRVPRFLPPQVRAILRAGQELGDLRKVFPACRRLLQDAVSQTRGAVPYLFMISFLTVPVAILLFIKVVPVFPGILQDVLGRQPTMPQAVFNHGWVLIAVQLAVVALLLACGLVYVGGPRLVRWFPFVDFFQFLIPWKRTQMRRDFSTMLAILLDAGLPEMEAVRLAADCTANRIFRRRAARVVKRLGEGVKLAEAIQALDDKGEFAWRLRNAVHERTHFLRALAGWHESLDAKAFQQEQAASQSLTSALVLWNGVFVGLIACSIFYALVSIIYEGVLW